MATSTRIQRKRYFISILVALNLLLLYAQSPVVASSAQPADPNQAANREALQDDLRKIGQEAVLEQLRSLRTDTQTALQSVGETGRFASSTDLLEFHKIDEAVIAKIKGRKDAIRRFIWETASRIENNRDVTITFDDRAAQLSISQSDLDSVKRLNAAIQDNNISLRSLSLAIKMTADISQQLYEEASRPNQNDRKYDLYVEYTALVYELSAIVVDLLDNFEHRGVDELRRLHDERQQEVDKITGRIRNRIENSQRRRSENLIPEDQHQREVKTYNDWISALGVSLDAWKEVFSIVGNQETWAKNIKSKSVVFRELRDDAGLQLDVLAELGIARAALLSIDSIRQIVQFADVPLLTLNESVARELIGLSLPLDIEKPPGHKP